VKFLFSLIFMALFANSAFACRCSEPGAQHAYANADVVALVRIKTVDVLPEGLFRAHAEVDRTWKSSLTKTVDIDTSSLDNCEYRLQEGKGFLLYLKFDDQGKLNTYRCWGNLQKSNAGERLKWLKRHGKARRRSLDSSQESRTDF
jgi:hypothetical protein